MIQGNMKNYGKDYKKSGEKYEYVGCWYESSLSQAEYKKKAYCYGSMLTLSCILLLMGLSMNHAGNRIFWILIPYTMTGLPLLYGWAGCAALFQLGRKNPSSADPSMKEIPKEHREHLRRSEYEQAVRRPLRCSVAVTILSAVTLLADLILVGGKLGEVQTATEILYAGDVLLICLLGIGMMVQCRKVCGSVKLFNSK